MERLLDNEIGRESYFLLDTLRVLLLSPGARIQYATTHSQNNIQTFNPRAALRGIFLLELAVSDTGSENRRRNMV